VLIIRNDDFTVMKGGEGIRKHRGEESYGCSGFLMIVPIYAKVSILLFFC
jgi:hypothetical protein